MWPNSTASGKTDTGILRHQSPPDGFHDGDSPLTVDMKLLTCLEVMGKTTRRQKDVRFCDSHGHFLPWLLPEALGSLTHSYEPDKLIHPIMQTYVASVK